MLNEDSKTEFPFKTTRDVEELARVLHWAQIAILNPGKNQAHYASADELGLPDSIEVKFSPNIVRLDVGIRIKFSVRKSLIQRRLVGQAFRTYLFTTSQEL